MADEDQQQQQDGQQGAEQGAESGSAPRPSDDQIIGAIRELAGMVTNTQKQQQELQDKLENSLKQAGDNGSGQQQEEDLDLSNIPDLESMDRKQFADFLTGHMTKKVKSLIEGVNKQVGEVAETAKKTAVETQIEKAAGKFNDFYDWSNEMRDTHKRNPTLTVEEAYKLARANNPEKAARLDAHYKAASDSGGKNSGDDKSSQGGGGEQSSGSGSDDSSGEQGKQSYGGMPPGGGKTATPRNMTKEQAIEDAWNKTMQGFTPPE